MANYYFEGEVPEGLLASAWLGDPAYTSQTRERDWLARVKSAKMGIGVMRALGHPCERMYVYDKAKQLQLRYGTTNYCIAHHGGFLDVKEVEHVSWHPVPQPVASQDAARWFQPPDYDLFLLSIAAKTDISTFLEIVKQVDWDHKTAEDFVSGIDLALEAGAHVTARELAMQGAEIHFDNEELQKYARILAPPRILKERPSSGVKPKANIEWLKTNRANYRGQWVALKNGTLIASAKTHGELTAIVGQTKGSGILVTNLY